MLARDKPRLLWAGATAIVLGVADFIVGRPPWVGWFFIGFGLLLMLTWLGLSRRGI